MSATPVHLPADSTTFHKEEIKLANISINHVKVGKHPISLLRLTDENSIFPS
jgi:hypothetical protein